MDRTVLNYKSIVAFALLLVIYQCGEHPSEQGWQILESSDQSTPVARHECGFLEHQGKFYLLGGRSLLPTSIYDPVAKSWTLASAPPLEIHHFQPVSIRNYIVIVGAFTGSYPNEKPVSNVLVYDPPNDRWVVLDTIPQNRARGSGGTIAYKDQLYWVGGQKDGHIGGHVPFVDRYDPIAKQWTILEDAPRARDHFQAAVLQDKIYVGGGRRTSAPFGVYSLPVAEVDVYDLTSGSWSTLDISLPTPRGGTLSAAFQNQYVVAGGEVEYDNYCANLVEVYHPDLGQWTTFPSLLLGRHGTGMVLYQKKLYIACGSHMKGPEPELNSMEFLEINN